MCDKGTKVIETSVETIPTPTRVSTCSMTVTSISPPPGLELPKVRYSASSIPVDMYSTQSKNNDNAQRLKPKRRVVREKIDMRRHGEPTSARSKFTLASGGSSPKLMHTVGTPISLFAATSGLSSSGHPSKPALLSTPSHGGKLRSSHLSCPGSGRAISLVDATVGTPISLSSATAHLPRTSIYTTHIEADPSEGISSMMLSPRSAAGLYTSSPMAGMYLPSAFGMPTDYSGAPDTSYSGAPETSYSGVPDTSYSGVPDTSYSDFYAATLADSMRPSVQMRSPTNADASTPVTLSLWGQKEPLQDYYASMMDNGERSTTSDEESKGDRSPAQKWLEDGTTMLQAALSAETPATEAPAYYPWLMGGIDSDEAAFPSANLPTMWGSLDKLYDDPSLRLVTQDASTLVWISEMAFKQSGTGTREALESFGVPLKAHKSSHKAIRSLGKREAKVIRFDSAIVIVSTKEASEFMQFLAAASEGGAEIRPCCVIVGPGNIHPDLHRFTCFQQIPQSTCVRFCQTWEEIYSLVGSMLEQPLQSV